MVSRCRRVALVGRRGEGEMRAGRREEGRMDTWILEDGK